MAEGFGKSKLALIIGGLLVVIGISLGIAWL